MISIKNCNALFCHFLAFKSLFTGSFTLHWYQGLEQSESNEFLIEVDHRKHYHATDKVKTE